MPKMATARDGGTPASPAADPAPPEAPPSADPQ
jgi:hypothetical protein